MISYELSHYQLTKRFKSIRKTKHRHLGDAILFKDTNTNRRVIAKVFNFVYVSQLQQMLAQIQNLLELTNPRNCQHSYQNNFCQFLAYTVNLSQQHTKQAYFLYDYHSKTLSEEIQHMRIHHKRFEQKDIVKFMEKMSLNLDWFEKRNRHHECLSGQLILVDNLDTIECSFKMLLTPFLKQATEQIVKRLQDSKEADENMFSKIEDYNLSRAQLRHLNNKFNSNRFNKQLDYRNKSQQEQKYITDKQSLGLLLTRIIGLQSACIYTQKSINQHSIVWNELQIKKIIQEHQISSAIKNIVQTLLFSQNNQFISFWDLHLRAKQLKQNFDYGNGNTGKRSMSNSRRSGVSHGSRENSADKRHFSSNSKEANKINWDSRTNSAYTQSPPKQQQINALSSQLEGSRRLKQVYFNSDKSKKKTNIHKKWTIQEVEERVLLDQQGRPYPGIVQKQYKDGAKYVGQLLQNTIRHGKGVYYYDEGDVYGGQWNYDTLQGHGLYLFSNGQFYQGQIRDGLKHGEGIYTYANGNKYSGQWQSDKKEGQGCYQYVNRGDRYQGGFRNGLRQGNGVYFWRNGDQYEGQFVANLKHGHGRGILSNSTVISGKWINDQICGVVKIKFAKGDQYIGQFKQNALNGCGNYKYQQGTLYQGQLKQNEQSGKCEIHFPNGDIYTGQFYNGKFQGKGKYCFKSQEMIYQGHWSNGVQNGKGRVIFANGSIIQSDWYSGVSAKNGTIFYPNMDKYVGQINSNGRNGSGVYHFANGRSLKGKWQNNRPQKYL